jgi:all-trans-retinol 13,14-reductase
MSQHLSKSYKQEKITGKFDAVVIGSGLGGLSTAAFLSKEGKKVLVLERHYTPGGFTHTFKRRGYEWDVGVHYVGEVHRPGSELARMFNYITDGSLQWVEMDEVYDKIFFGEDEFHFVKEPEAFKAKLKTYFPEETKAIDAYVDLIYVTQRSQKLFFAEKILPQFISFLFGKFFRSKALTANRTTLETLKTLTSNKKLIAVLSAQFGDYGLSPSESSFMMHAMLVKHYMKGGAYPVGGSAKIFESIAPVILKNGGTVFTNAEVKEIVLQKGTAVGVRMFDGQEIYAPIVISDAGIFNTYSSLLTADAQKQVKAKEFLKELKPSVGHVSLYIGINKSNEELKLGRANYWIFPDNYDHDLNISNYLNNPDAEIPVAYISFPSSKDPSWSERYPGKTTIEIVTLAPFAWYAKWEKEKWMKRGDDYEAMKEKLALRLLEILFKKHPELRGQIDHYELSTPLSTQHFVNYSYGEIYGIDHSVQRFNQKFLRPKTPIKNLFLTGQDIVSCGIGGALASGMLTAMSITGRNLTSRFK